MSIEFIGHQIPARQRGIIVRYTGFKEISAAPVVMREHPCTYVPLIIDFEQGWRVTHLGREGERPRPLGSFVAGLIDAPVQVEHPGAAGCVQVDLTPLGARRILGIPLSELENRSVPLDDVLGRHTLELGERLAETGSWASRFRLVERMIDARLAQTQPVSSELDWALAQVVGTEQARIASVARDLGWSHRRLIRCIRDATGITPKRLQRIARLERLERRLGSGEESDFARLAPSLGFSDQSHLAREVRALTGLTPRELHAHAVNFVQEAPLLEG